MKSFEIMLKKNGKAWSVTFKATIAYFVLLVVLNLSCLVRGAESGNDGSGSVSSSALALSPLTVSLMKSREQKNSRHGFSFYNTSLPIGVFLHADESRNECGKRGWINDAAAVAADYRTNDVSFYCHNESLKMCKSEKKRKYDNSSSDNWYDDWDWHWNWHGLRHHRLHNNLWDRHNCDAICAVSLMHNVDGKSLPALETSDDEAHHSDDNEEEKLKKKPRKVIEKENESSFRDENGTEHDEEVFDQETSDEHHCHFDEKHSRKLKRQWKRNHYRLIRKLVKTIEMESDSDDSDCESDDATQDLAQTALLLPDYYAEVNCDILMMPNEHDNENYLSSLKPACSVKSSSSKYNCSTFSLLNLKKDKIKSMLILTLFFFISIV